MNDWFYKKLSQDSHLSWPGLIRRGGFLLNPDREERESALDKYRSNCFCTTLTVLFALLSEIQIELGYDLAERLKYLWTFLGDFFGESKEAYEKRYQRML